MIDRAAQLIAALAIDAAVGYPAWLFASISHPVSWVGVLIAWLDERWNAGSSFRRRAMGVSALGAIVIVSGGIGWWIERLLGSGWTVIGLVLIVASALAQRSLDDHVAAVARPLAAGDLHAARRAVSAIVGRDTAALDDRGVSIAAIESLAESFCDGVVAPAFWFLVGGLPGMLVCKAVNTADSMIGHRDAHYRDFGWASARADDFVMLVPARLAGPLIAIAGGSGMAAMGRDAGRHASPNGGWPEAAMAGALRRQLGGPVSYDGIPAPRATLGDGPAPDAADLWRALWIYRRACLLLWVIVGAVAWAR